MADLLYPIVISVVLYSTWVTLRGKWGQVLKNYTRDVISPIALSSGVITGLLLLIYAVLLPFGANPFSLSKDDQYSAIILGALTLTCAAGKELLKVYKKLDIS
jgi:hypothetical protein